MKRFLLIFFVLITSLACNTTLVEEVVETYADGSSKLVRYYNDDGKTRDMVREVMYYPNHQKYMEGEYKNGKKHGKWTAWYQNGNKWSEGYFSEGLDDGNRTAWFESGQKRFEGQYSKGKKSGVWKFWDEKGAVVNEVDYDKQ